MKIAVFGQFYNEFTEISINKLFAVLEKKNNVKVYIERAFFSLIKQECSNTKVLEAFSVFERLDRSFDFLISIGGDGTILRAITHVKDLNIPIVGINTGRLGFLATIQLENIENAIQDIIEGHYNISERTLLSVETTLEQENITSFNFALNEVTVSRKNTTSMITVNTHLNGEYLTSYWSDGLIVSTPTGSTGYSLSCGGPVIMPNSSNVVLTPIASHNLNARPLIIPDSTSIELKVSGREDYHLLSLDSRIMTLKNETPIFIKKADFKIRLISLKNEIFLDTLRKKLLWGADTRNNK